MFHRWCGRVAVCRRMHHSCFWGNCSWDNLNFFACTLPLPEPRKIHSPTKTLCVVKWLWRIVPCRCGHFESDWTRRFTADGAITKAYWTRSTTKYIVLVSVFINRSVQMFHREAGFHLRQCFSTFDVAAHFSPRLWFWAHFTKNLFQNSWLGVIIALSRNISRPTWRSFAANQ